MTGPLIDSRFILVHRRFPDHRELVFGASFHATKLERAGDTGSCRCSPLCLSLGVGAGCVLYKGQAKEPILIPPLKDKLYFDEIYAALIAGTQDLLATIARLFDNGSLTACWCAV